MRVKHSMINVFTGIGSQIIITLLSFISRSVFIYYLGVEYLGINGLFTNILGMLSLAEAGIGSAIIYSLYKPVAENDTKKIRVLMKFYRNAYLIIAVVILLLGLSLLPFLEYFIKEASIDNIHLIYGFFLINTVSSYLFSHKISFLNVCQKGYIVTGIYTISSLVTTLIRLLVLFLTQNYLLYLITELVVNIATSLVIADVVGRKYPYLKSKEKASLEQEDKKSIVKNVKALVMHRIGGYMVFGTDNIIIASYVSLAAVGLYSNYSMLINICRTLIGQIFDNITHSVGNLVALEDDNKIYEVFKIIMLCNFWIYSFFSIILFITIEPFISLWLGNDFIMANSILIILLISFYVSGMRRSISSIKTTAGIFQEDRFVPFFEAAINLGASIILVKYMGIAGVFLGTLISTLLGPFWIAPYLVYKKVFHISVVDYFKRYLLFLFIGISTCMVTNLITNSISIEGILGLILKGIICLIIPNLLFLIVFSRTKEFQYITEVIWNLFNPRIKKSTVQKVEM
ncbi:lipopolysaccharide biosynthesis protein [Metabacillus halosaccharovorans]|uniref:lipopolysaccharide biosynthesis protein n=1 Tax=Metabacillus halosaccharovorans TaxID=930124 RepID=UPI0034CF8A05